MSYILDALKKAEADRDPDTRARLAFEQRERRRSRFVTYAVLTALIANAVILLWLFLPDALTEPSAVVSITPAVDGAVTEGTLEPAPIRPVLAPGTVPPQPETTAPARALATPVDPSPMAAERQAAAAPRPEPETLDTGELRIGPRSAVPTAAPVPLVSLPEATRRRFPALSFSTHIYADEPGLRAVVVNGRRLTEGDRLGELTLQQITEEGAVFSFEGRSVEVGVLDAWN